MQVNALPKHNKPVNGIGNFSLFDITLKPSVVKQHEGMVLTLSVEGDGNLDAVKLPELINMPESLKWYDSKTYCEGLKKCQEFIVQGLQVGEWEIPSQEFVYFDVKKHEYKTLTSAPLMVTILPDKQTKTLVQNDEPKNVTKEVDTELFDNESPALPINEQGPWRSTKERLLSPWLFLALICIPFGIWLLDLVRKMRTRSKTSLLSRKKYAFVQARKRIERAKLNHTPGQLYTIFIELFAARAQCKKEDMSGSVMEKMLHHYGVDQQECLKWHAFFSRLTELEFFIGKDVPESIFDKALEWVKRLEGIV